MTDLDKAVATQLANIERRSGQSLDALAAIVRNSGLHKHGELVTMLKSTLGLGHGDANLVVHTVRQTAGPAAASTAAGAGGEATVLDGLYAGPKAALRPIHEAILAAMQPFGAFEVAPKKSYVSYRRRKQFCMVGPATNTRVEVGLNMSSVAGPDRLEALPAGQMCPYKVRLTEVAQVDAELVAWLRRAYEESA